MILNFRVYSGCSIIAALVVVTYATLTYEEFYPIVVYLSTNKLAMAVMYNFAFVLFFRAAQALLKFFIGHLRELEIEHLIEQGRAFLFDTILFLVFSSPLVEGREAGTVHLFQCICWLVALRLSHIVVQVRLGHMFEIGIPRLVLIQKMALLLFLLLLLDLLMYSVFYRHSSNNSTLYTWLAFETLAMTSGCLVSIGKFCVLLLDSSLDHGWSSKASCLFYLDLIGDCVSMCIFLLFIVTFFLHNPSKLPLYMMADILQVGRQLLLRLQSFRKFRQLTKNMNENFPDATLDELESADTCIICRDALHIGSKKLPCGHVFHSDCLRSWFVQQQTCPTCRAEVVGEGPSSPTSQADGDGAREGGETEGATGDGEDAEETAVEGEQDLDREAMEDAPPSEPEKGSQEAEKKKEKTPSLAGFGPSSLSANAPPPSVSPVAAAAAAAEKRLGIGLGGSSAPSGTNAGTGTGAPPVSVGAASHPFSSSWRSAAEEESVTGLGALFVHRRPGNSPDEKEKEALSRFSRVFRTAESDNSEGGAGGVTGGGVSGGMAAGTGPPPAMDPFSPPLGELLSAMQHSYEMSRYLQAQSHFWLEEMKRLRAGAVGKGEGRGQEEDERSSAALPSSTAAAAGEGAQATLLPPVSAEYIKQCERLLATPLPPPLPVNHLQPPLRTSVPNPASSLCFTSGTPNPNPKGPAQLPSKEGGAEREGGGSVDQSKGGVAATDHLSGGGMGPDSTGLGGLGLNASSFSTRSTELDEIRRMSKERYERHRGAGKPGESLGDSPYY
uniref:RING-type E3 ubiquitin transferase n=1 Tax=Chromera velia CCMP2878 TaxID=1169474 RepID=A0A0G4FIQ2_9ALVE|eukprot:Cvel_17264.t1-p1 / transcript=Cvel_17264.t1 / gene=Cvel_17264 / organism=Chromera_velia_CCMP2878 / gene_product=E3 ubiquitin-protein ligase synoviolin A, putative / transcript_product=E3 ubiquitin-protein ligase synoviolin A, putative / location=Cvel_scaffold1368:32199-38255(-) / protein_length=781 / sequence_SO=supercontig / SO=protein_coding / is_pseudo=false